MKLKRVISLLTAVVMAAGTFTFAGTGITAAAEKNSILYNFAEGSVTDAVNLNDGTVPVYDEATGYGFVSTTSSMPERSLSTDSIQWNSEGFMITEDGSGSYLHNTNTSNYNYGGLVFRTDVETGSYRLIVELSNGSTSSNTTVVPTGMQASRITSSSYWDSAKKVPVQHYAKWTDSTTWTYDYVTGEPFIEFEIEPTALATSTSNKTVGVKSISIEKLENNTVSEGDIPSVYVMGDSTEKTYTFEEAGMSGWGQIIGTMFDETRVNIVNYSMGGRSMKAMYTENRFNDVLLTAKPGDYILIHSAHNDESTGDSAGPEARFGRGSTTATYTRWLNNIYIPAILSRGAVPVLVTPMPRTSNGTYTSGFSPDSPGLMKAAAAANDDVYLIDLYTNAKEYIDEMGTAQTLAIYMSIEAGESPGKTNSGSYANGHPDNKVDGTHQKEAASKVWSKIIAEEIYAQKDDATMGILASCLKDDVQAACVSGDWNTVFPEWTDDVTYAKSGDGTAANDPTYYRNQIEKLLQLGVMQKTDGNNFSPLEAMSTNDFISSLCAVWGLDLTDASVNAVFEPYYESGTLIREEMAAIILDAYVLRFGLDSDGSYNKPAYMTDYNGTTVSPDDPTYDPNLTGEDAQYYPLVGWGNLTDKEDISLEYAEDVYDVYNLGLMRSESGITRGKMVNGTLFEPKAEVTRAKAAKELWFLWVLGQEDVLAENQILTITTDGTSYAEPVYTEVSYTAPAYEFSSVNIANDGALSVELLDTIGASTAATLNIAVYNADGTQKDAKTYLVSGSGAVSGIDITLSTDEFVIMSVTASDGTALSAERVAICTELVVPARSYTASTVAGIKNGTLALENLSDSSAEETAEAEATSISFASVDLADDSDDSVFWTASEDVTGGTYIFTQAENGCDLVPTCDMTYTKSSQSVGDQSFTGYVAHSSTNGYLASTGRERSGFTFTPTSDGVLTAYVSNLGSNKNFVIIDDSETSESKALASSQDPTVLSGNTVLTAAVTAGTTYYIGVLGSKGRYLGISFSPGAPVVSTLAKCGETVQITATPNDGYIVEAISAVDANGNTVELDMNSAKTVSTFTMPEADVTISASFIEGDSSDEPVVPDEPAVEGLIGDIDNNEILTANDCAALLYYVINGEKNEEWNVADEIADTDGNGNITAADAAQILSKVLDASYKFSAEE